MRCITTHGRWRMLCQKKFMARTLPPPPRVHTQAPVRRAAEPRRRPVVLPVPSLTRVLCDDPGVVGDAIRTARQKSGPIVFLTPQAESRWAKDVLLKAWAFNQREINRGWMQDDAAGARAMQAQLLQTIDSLNELYGRE